MVVSDHYGSRCAGTDDSASIIHHGEMNKETNFLAMMPTVTCDTEW
jgi:hypothetical protein